MSTYLKKLAFLSVFGFFALAPTFVSAQLAPGADGLIRPSGIASPTECLQAGGTWTQNTFADGQPVGTYNVYQCGFTQSQYNKAFNITPASPATPNSQGNTNPFCQNGSCTYVPLEPLPLLPNCFGPNCSAIGKTGGNFQGLIGGSFKLLIGAGGLIAVVMIILGALTYMFSDVVGNKTKALARIRNAMWAVVLLVSSYLILYTINPDLVNLNLNLSPASNFNTTPNAPGSITPAQATQAQVQAAQTQCAQQGKTLHANNSGAYSCT